LKIKRLPSDEALNNVLQSCVAAREVTAPECKTYFVMPPSRNGCNKSSIEPVSDPEINPCS